MYWIGYIYRYFAIICELTSVQVYKIIKTEGTERIISSISYHGSISGCGEDTGGKKKCQWMRIWNWNVNIKYSKKIRMQKTKNEQAGVK